MKSRMFAWIGVLVVSLNLLVGWRVYDAYATTVAEDDMYANVSVLTRALMLIRQDYVDPEKVSFKQLTYNALKGMLANLDPHSQFMEPEDFTDMKDDTRSRFGGLGIEISTRDGAITVVTPMDGSPAAKAGVMSGDQITKIDGEPTDKMDSGQAVGKLRGEPGTKVALTVFRSATKEIKEFLVTRDVIKVESVRGKKMMQGPETNDFKIGYIRINQFSEPTAEELGKKLDELEADGMQALILDLRNNPGGLLASAVDVCGQFVEPNTMVVYTDGPSASAKREYRTKAVTKSRVRTEYPIAILINNGSASGSEIVAGALKDLNRAVIIGETTFGKGSVQSVLPLPDASAMRLTTAKYYTPSRQVIHEVGVSPTIFAVMTPEQEIAMARRRSYESLTDEEKAEVDRHPDTQLNRALDALKGVLIYHTAKSAVPAPESKTETN